MKASVALPAPRSSVMPIDRSLNHPPTPNTTALHEDTRQITNISTFLSDIISPAYHGPGGCQFKATGK